MDEFSNPTTTTARFYFQPLNETQVYAYLDLNLKDVIIGKKYIQKKKCHCISSVLLPVQDIEVRFSPEVVVIGTDPRTGLLTREFTIMYSIGSKSNPLLSVNHEGPLGVVSVQVPFKTSLVSPRMQS